MEQTDAFLQEINKREQGDASKPTPREAAFLYSCRILNEDRTRFLSKFFRSDWNLIFFFCICVLLVGLGFFLFLLQITCFLLDSGMGSSALLGGSRRSSVCIGFGDVFVRPPLICWYSAHALQLFQSLLCFGCQKYMKLQKVFLMLTAVRLKMVVLLLGFFYQLAFFNIYLVSPDISIMW